MRDRVESSLAELIETYHRHGLEHRPEDSWAWDRVGHIVRGPDAERAWERGAQLVGDVVQYEESYRLCYIRGPEGILIGLAEELR